jgi:hypothetical protein
MRRSAAQLVPRHVREAAIAEAGACWSAARATSSCGCPRSSALPPPRRRALPRRWTTSPPTASPTGSRRQPDLLLLAGRRQLQGRQLRHGLVQPAPRAARRVGKWCVTVDPGRIPRLPALRGARACAASRASWRAAGSRACPRALSRCLRRRPASADRARRRALSPVRSLPRISTASTSRSSFDAHLPERWVQGRRAHALLQPWPAGRRAPALNKVAPRALGSAACHYVSSMCTTLNRPRTTARCWATRRRSPGPVPLQVR